MCKWVKEVMVIIHGLGANPWFSSIVQLCILHPERAKVPKQDHKRYWRLLVLASMNREGSLQVDAIRFLLLF